MGGREKRGIEGWKGRKKEREKYGEKGGEGVKGRRKTSKSGETEVWKWCFASKLCKHSSNRVCCRVTS